MRRVLATMAAALFLGGCAIVGAHYYDERFGTPDPTRYDTVLIGEMSFRDDVQPILNRRCVVCHACYDSPCQLNLGSWDGVVRGASNTTVYNASRVLAAPTTRLHIDAEHASDWRKLGFHPVLNEQTSTPENNQAASLLFRMLELKQQHPNPSRNDYAALDFSLDRKQICSPGNQFGAYVNSSPFGGMPFGLPAIPTTEHSALTRWLALGAPGDAPKITRPELQTQINNWEFFLNGDSPREQLVTRYIYEHLFLAHVFFPEARGAWESLTKTERVKAKKDTEYFRLVRSSTPPGKPVHEIATRRPVDPPGVERVYYRLIPERDTIVNKTHMPYPLDTARMARWRSLFFSDDYTVSKLPGYEAEDTANPFKTYQEIPVVDRYRFMLDEAEFTVMNFIKGPVCRGQLALNVIDDQFWVFFAPPPEESEAELMALLADYGNLLRLPTGRSNSNILVSWLRYGDLERRYLKAKSAFLKKRIARPENLTLKTVWDGDNDNPNAALTVFRHFDSASVVKGLLGDTPKTAWIISYPMLERIHYLLVANYDVFGNVGHQFNSRLYMEYLRMEGEFNTLILLPQAERIKLRDYWYRGDSLETREQVYGGDAVLPIESGIQYKTKNPMRELMLMLRERFTPILDRQHDIALADADLRPVLQRLANVRSAGLAQLPELSYLIVNGPKGYDRYFTVIRNTSHSTVSYLLNESNTLVPQENTLTVARGLIGSYPNAFYRTSLATLPNFVDAVSMLSNEKDYEKLAERFAVRRDAPDFWTFSDALHNSYPQRGLLDYTRLENR